jgi:hyaluronoglucosaminidase
MQADAVGKRPRAAWVSDAHLKAGVIEGFFGKPWDWPARLSSADFLRDCGYQFYIYAPKADPFLRRRWREPLPAETLQHLRELSERCRARDISFGIGLTPFEIYLNYDARAQMSLRSKVRQIDGIGVDLLGILFDDMRGDVDGLAELQAKVLADICAWSSAERFIVCPTYYSYDARLMREFGPPPKTYLRDLGRIVDPRIDFFWTGEKVISDTYSAEHLVDVAGEIGRKPFIWDNHISNDSRTRTNHLFLDPSAGSWELPVDRVAGLAINPMNQPYLSRIALCGYRQLLADRSESRRLQDLPGICRNLCGSPVAARLLADIDLLQNKGLAQLDADTRLALLDRYGGEKSNPYAQEIVAWLRGEYVFDPQCLTT